MKVRHSRQRCLSGRLRSAEADAIEGGKAIPLCWAPHRLIFGLLTVLPAIDGMHGNSVGVKEASRPFSRIRHRQFGVLVTTSFVAAYSEVREDRRHRIIFFSGKDIADVLTANGYGTPELVENFLQNEFAVPGGAHELQVDAAVLCISGHPRLPAHSTSGAWAPTSCSLMISCRPRFKASRWM